MPEQNHRTQASKQSCRQDEHLICSKVAMSTHKIKTLEEAIALRNRLQEAGQKLVLSTGVFDILQIAHVRHLNAARTLGDALIVGLYSDRTIQEAEGSSFPIVPEMERAEVLAALSSVDCIVIVDDADSKQFVESIAPDVLANETEDASTAAIIEKVLTEFGKVGSSDINREFSSMQTEPKQ
jgi:D-glycero-beta-D-manno-heptose 1-phosphate adenylyltransferase